MRVARSISPAHWPTSLVTIACLTAERNAGFLSGRAERTSRLDLIDDGRAEPTKPADPVDQLDRVSNIFGLRQSADCSCASRHPRLPFASRRLGRAAAAGIVVGAYGGSEARRC
jgi:hypothetical protein